MRYKRLLQRSGFVPALLLFAAGWLTAAASPMGYEDLRRLLRADFPEDVVLAILEEEGAPHLSPQEWLALRSLGASDRLLLALLADEPAPRDPSEQEGPPTPSAGPEGTGPASTPVAPDFRAFYREEADGSQVFVLTNLDVDGQRLGGAADRPAGRNRIESPRPRPPREETVAGPAVPASDPYYVPPAGRAAPVTAIVAEPMAVPTAFVPVSRYYGFFYPYPLSHFYPPGSYTHFKLYHDAGSPGFGHYQVPAGQIFYGPPFPTAGAHRRRTR